MKESKKEGSFFSEGGYTTRHTFIAIAIAFILLVPAFYLGNQIAYKDSIQVSHYDISNITYQVEPIPDKLNIWNVRSIFREIIKVNSTNTYNKIYNLSNSQVEFKNSFYEYIFKYYVDKGNFWTNKGFFRGGVIPSLNNAIRILNAAENLIVNNPDAAISVFLKYPSDFKDRDKLLEALQIARININKARETFKLLDAKIIRQQGDKHPDVAGAGDIKSFKMDISYLLDDLIANSDHLYDSKNEGDVRFKAVLNEVVGDFKKRELASGDTLKEFLTEANQFIRKILGESKERSFLGELVSGYMSDMENILSALDKEKSQGSSPLRPEEAKKSGVSPAINAQDQDMAKEFYDDYIVNGEYKKHPAFSNAHNEQDMGNILASFLKNNIFKKYPQPIGTEVNAAREIISKYFIIEFNTDHPKDSIISLKESGASSALTKTNAAPAQIAEKWGGIDFTRINYLTRPVGSFQGLDLRLPLLTKAELEGIDINRELAAVEQMINAKVDVSTDRLKCLLAAMRQKDAFSAQRETQLLPLLLRLCWLKEDRGIETTPDFRAVLLIADTGLFVEQGNTRYSLN